jgi:putative mycofactocin binding protein MftB
MPAVDAPSTLAASTLADRALEVHPRVALRREPFGALAYHYDTRRLVFLKHPDLVAVVEALAEHATLGHTLEACGVEPSRRSAFATAIGSLIESEMVRDRPR